MMWLARTPTARTALTGVLVLGAALATSAGAAFAAVQLQLLVTGLSSPVFVTSARDGTNRLFIVEQGGLIKVLQPGSTTPTVFRNITGRVATGGEQGLLGLAFHPNFVQNRRFFVNFTRKSDGASVIGEFKASATNPNVAPNTQRRLLLVKQPFENHNGGMIAFGPDGYLYIGFGDGGSGNDPGDRAQKLGNLLGKMLRIDVNTTSGNKNHGVPADNPFVGVTGKDEIWAYGFRNPWRWSFDRLTGDLWLGDVGQGAKEEVDVVVRGGNYGWRVFEGTNCTTNDPDKCDDGGFIAPVNDYDNAGARCAITGGYVYRGTLGTLPANTYTFGDFCSGEIFTLPTGGGSRSTLLDTSLMISSFGEDEAGEILVVDLNGAIYRLVNVP